MKEIKQKNCIICNKEFMPFRTFDKVCSGLCARKVQVTKVPRPKRKRIKGISERRKAQNELYLRLRENYLKKRSKCEGCGESATEIHHKNGRTNDRLVDIMYFMSICRACHNWIHNNPIEARSKKWLE